MFYTSSLSRSSGRALRRVLQTSNYHRERGQGVPCAICFALLEIITGLPHGVGDVGEAKHSYSGASSKCVQGCRFHLDREDAFGTCSLDGLCGLPKGRVGSPARPYDAVKPALCQRHCSLLHKGWVCLRELRRRRIMVAGPFIAQRAVDHHEVGRLPRRDNLTRRGQTNQQLASAGEQLFSYKDGEGCTNNPANNSGPVAAKVERVEFRVIAGPTREPLRRPSLSQLAHQVAIRV